MEKVFFRGIYRDRDKGRLIHGDCDQHILRSHGDCEVLSVKED